MNKLNRTMSAVLSAYLAQTMHAVQQPATEQPKEPVKQPIPAGSAEFSFHFRTEKLRDEVGGIIGEGKKLPTIKAILPVPSDEDLINFIAANGKEAQFLRDVVSEAIETAARGQINEYREDNKNVEVITADVLDLSKLTFSAIANTPKKDRAAPEIPEEVFNTFFEDYKTVMVASGKEAVRVQKHIVLFKAQFRTCKFDKPALSVLRDSLNLYAAKTENMEDNAQVFELLLNKVEKYLKAEEKNLVGAL